MQPDPHAPHDPEGDELTALPEVPRPRPGTLVAVALAGAGLLGGLFLAGLLPKLARERALRAESSAVAATLPRVTIATPRRAQASSGVSLPGSVQALRETTVFARTSGYVKRRLVDIGDKVVEGQLLAELEIPDVHQERLQADGARAQAQASLEQAKSSLDFSKVSADRTTALAPEGLATQQDLDQKRSALAGAGSGVRAAEATVRSADARVRQLAELESFARVTAPFAGTVTARTVEVGALVTAGNGVGQALFKVAEVDRLRVFVGVPQAYASHVRTGEKATVTVRELAGRSFPGTITRAAGALDPVARTMLTEVEVGNEDGALLPGMYAQVDLRVAGVEPPLLVPGSALIVSAEGTALATVGADRRVHLVKVVIEADYGAEVGIATGLAADAQVVTNPGERLREGGEVEIAAVAPTGAKK